MSQTMRAAVALVTAAAFLLGGCSQHAALVPERELAARTEWEGLYRVTTTTDKYTTRQFSVSDSTLVISRFGVQDKHYNLVKVPLTIPLGDVKSVERLEGHGADTFIAVACFVVIGLFIAAGIVVSQSDWGADE
jgi:hypothetical protein